nr:MAG: polyprotein [Wufeng shrew iflavirus 11]
MNSFFVSSEISFATVVGRKEPTFEDKLWVVDEDYPIEFFKQRPYAHALQYGRVRVDTSQRCKFSCQTFQQFLRNPPIGVSRRQCLKLRPTQSCIRPIKNVSISGWSLKTPQFKTFGKVVATSVKQQKLRVSSFQKEDKSSFLPSQNLFLPNFVEDVRAHPKSRLAIAMARKINLMEHSRNIGNDIFIQLILFLEQTRLVKFESPILTDEKLIKFKNKQFKSPKFYSNYKPAFKVFEQADAHGEQMPVKIEQSGNVILTSQRTDSKPEVPVRVSRGFLPEASARESQTLEQLTGRWLIAKQFQWKTSDTPGKEVASLILPLDVLQANVNSPNVMPFFVHHYARFDMKVKIQVSSVRLQIGQLQSNWFYGASAADPAVFDLYDNVYSASQRLHCLNSAGQANDGTIDIPYWSAFSACPIKTDSLQSVTNTSILDLGKLSIKVLNQLKVASGVSNEVSVTVWVSIDNVEFRAMKSRALGNILIDPAVEQMDVIGGTVKAAESILPTLSKIFNADNPPAHTNSISFQPTASHSFANTDGVVERVRVMRADPISQTPKVPGFKNKDNTLFELCRKWSLVETIQWKTSHEAGVVLFDHFSSPRLFSSPSNSHTEGNGSKTYYPTILNYLSRHFAYWSGELEVRLDVIANTFYTGRIAPYIVPGMNKVVSLRDASCSSGQVFDLQENLSFVFTIPFYANTPAWPVYSEMAHPNFEELAPSVTTLYVINRLVTSDNVPDTVDINIYLRGSTNFEFLLLKTPDISAFLNQIVHRSSSSVARIDPSWASAFTAGSRWTDHGGDEYCCVFYNQTTDYFTQFLNFDFEKDGKKVYYAVPSDQEIGGKFYRWLLPIYTSKTAITATQYLCRLKQYPDYPVALAMGNETRAKEYVVNYDLTKANVYIQQGQYMLVAIADSVAKLPAYPSTPNFTGFTQATSSQLALIEFPEIALTADEADFVVLEQMDELGIEKMPVVRMNAPSAPTLFGSKLFNEKIVDVKSMCRRWQFLGCHVGSTVSNVKCLMDSVPTVYISTSPMRRFDASEARENALREGLITNIGALFAGYRGSMRYRLIVTSKGVESSISMAVKHDYMAPMRSQITSVAPAIIPNPSVADYLDTSFAVEYQATDVNPVLEIEIPFYNRGEFNYLYKPHINKKRIIESFCESGTLDVHLATASSIKYSLEVLYSVADDFEFAVFQGCPRIIELAPLGQSDEIGEKIVLEQSDNDGEQLVQSQGIGSMFLKTVQVAKNTIMSPTVVATAASSIASNVESSTGAISAVANKCSSFVDMMKSSFNSFVQFLPSCSSLSELCSKLMTSSTLFFTIIVQLLYVFFYPTILSVTVGLATILSAVSYVGGFNWGSNVVDKFIAFYTYITSPVPTQQSQGQETDALSTGVSLLWSSVMGALSFASKGKRVNCGEFTKDLFTMSGSVFRTHNFGVRFISDFIEMMRRMFSKINNWMSDEYPIFKHLNEDMLREWLIEALVVTDVNNQEHVKHEKSWSIKVFELYSKGSIYVATAKHSTNHLGTPLINYVEKIHNKLRELTEMLKQTNQFSPFRQEPFVLWLYSNEGGLGKSSYVNELIPAMAKEFNMLPFYFKKTAGSKYYDALTKEKFIVLDDFLSAKHQDQGEQLSQYLEIVGTSQLQLPRAALEKKLTYDDFEFVIVTSNYKNFDAENAASCKSAFNRRRDVIVEFSGSSRQTVSYKICVPQSEKSEVHIPIKNKEELTDYILKAAHKQRNIQAKLYQENLLRFNSAVKAVEKSSSFEEIREIFLSKCIPSNDKTDPSFKWVHEHIAKLKSWLTIKKREILSDTEKEEVAQLEAKLKERISKEEIKSEVSDQMGPEDTTVVEDIIEDTEHQKNLMAWCFNIPKTPDVVYTNSQKVYDNNVANDTPEHPNLELLFPNFLFNEDCFVNLKLSTRADIPPFGQEYSRVCEDGMCPLGMGKHFIFHRVNIAKFKNVLDTHDFFKEVDATLKQAWLKNASLGVLIDTTNSYLEKHCYWACCLCEGIEARNHSQVLMNDISCRVWKDTVNAINFKQFDIFSKNCCGFNRNLDSLNTVLPFYLRDRVKDLIVYDPKRYIVADSPVMSKIRQTVNQILNYFPKTHVIDDVAHPIPDDLSVLEEQTRQSKSESTGNWFKEWLGAVPTKVRMNINDEEKTVKAWSYPGWVRNLICLGSLFAFVSLLGSVIKLLMGIRNLFKGQSVVDQMLTSGSIGPGKQKLDQVATARTLLGRPNGLTQEEIVAIADVDSACNFKDPARLNKVLNNTCFLVCKSNYKEENGQATCNIVKHRCLGLYNSKILACHHYISHLKSLKQSRADAEFYLVRIQKKAGVDNKFWSVPILDIDNIEIFSYGTQEGRIGDLCVIDIGIQPSAFCDIRKFIPNSGTTHYASRNTLLQVDLKGDRSFRSIDTFFSHDKIVVSSTNRESSWTLGDHFTYNVGAPGMCGALVWNDSSNWPLIGFHTAGVNVSIGYAEPLLRQEYNLGDAAVLMPTPQMDLVEKYVLDVGYVEPIGTLPKQVAPFIPRKSQIIPSLAYGVFPNFTEPAPLSKHDDRLITSEDPLEVGLRKRGDPMVPFRAQDLLDASQHLLTKLLTKCVPSFQPVCKLTVKQSIEGLEGVKNCDSIEFATSEGYPWVKLRPKGVNDKSWLFELQDTSVGKKLISINSELEQTLEFKSRLRQRSCMPCTYYTAMLKDARILKEKVSIPGKTRVFEMSPIDLTIVQRQFMLPFCVSYMDCRFDCENTIGINVNGPEWTALYQNLVGFSDKILAGDYSSYGPKIEFNVLRHAITIVKDWTIYNAQLGNQPLTDSEINEFETLILEIIHSPIVAEGYVFRPSAGMASGNACTVIFNSLVNSLYIRLAYIQLARENAPQYLDLSFFDKFVRIFSNGDDIIMSVKDDIIDWFNNINICTFFLNHNLKYTNTDKDDNMVAYNNIFEVNYLKCKFYSHPFRPMAMLAPLDKRSIYDCAQWIFKSDRSNIDATSENCEQALRLAYGHGPVFFDKIRAILNKWYIENKLYRSLPVWSTLDILVWELNEIIITY